MISVETARAIGTGRVGNGMSSRQQQHNPQSKFTSMQNDTKSNAINRRNDQLDNNSSKAIFSTQPSNHNNVARSSVQDRLNRNRECLGELSKTKSNESAQLALQS